MGGTALHINKPHGSCNGTTAHIQHILIPKKSDNLHLFRNSGRNFLLPYNKGFRIDVRF